MVSSCRIILFPSGGRFFKENVMKKISFANSVSMRLAIIAAMFVLAVSALTACGGGGSSLPKPPGQNPPPANQQQFGSVEGRLTDSGLSLRGASQVSGSGENAPLPGVIVQLVNKATGIVFGEQMTNANGEFKFDLVPAGQEYTLRVKLELELDLNGDGTPDSVEIKFDVLVTPGQAAEILQALGFADSDGDGVPDALDVITQSRDGLGEREHRERMHGDGQAEVELKGVIEALGDGTITVGGKTFTIDEFTQFMDHNGNPALPETFTLGMFVEIEGVMSQDGTLVAHKVKVEDEDDNGTEIEIKGVIEAFENGSITVNGITFVITETTKFMDDNGNPVSPQTFAVGAFVEIEGFEGPDGTFFAHKIKAEDESGEDDGLEIEIKGAIEEIGDGTITVGGKVFVITETTKFLDDNGNPIPFESLQVGTFIEAEGVEQADGTVIAKKFKIEDENEDESGDDNGGDDENEDESGDDNGGDDNGGDIDDDNGDDDNGDDIDDDNGDDDNGDDIDDDNGGDDENEDESGDDNGGDDENEDESGDDNGGDDENEDESGDDNDGDEEEGDDN